MQDRAYLNALRRQKELKEELRKIEEFLELYEEFGSDVSVESGRMGRGEGTSEEPPGERTTDKSLRFKRKSEFSTRRRANPSKEKVAKLAKAAIADAGRPMTRRELLNALEDIGVSIDAKDPRKNLGTMLWRLRDEFENIEGYGYWPKDLPLPAEIQRKIDDDQSLTS